MNNMFGRCLHSSTQPSLISSHSHVFPQVNCSLTALTGLLQIFVGGQGSNTASYTYAILLPTPNIKAITPGFVALTSGGGSITLTGSKFGAATGVLQFQYTNQSAPGVVNVTGSYTVALNTTSWSDSAVTFSLPPGQGSPRLSMYIPGAENTTTTTFSGLSYDAAVVTGLMYNSSVFSTAGYVSGGPLLIISGNNFGPNDPGDYNQVRRFHLSHLSRASLLLIFLFPSPCRALSLSHALTFSLSSPLYLFLPLFLESLSYAFMIAPLSGHHCVSLQRNRSVCHRVLVVYSNHMPTTGRHWCCEHHQRAAVQTRPHSSRYRQPVQHRDCKWQVCVRPAAAAISFRDLGNWEHHRDTRAHLWWG